MALFYRKQASVYDVPNPADLIRFREVKVYYEDDASGRYMAAFFRIQIRDTITTDKAPGSAGSLRCYVTYGTQEARAPLFAKLDPLLVPFAPIKGGDDGRWYNVASDGTLRLTAIGNLGGGEPPNNRVPVASATPSLDERIELTGVPASFRFTWTDD